MTNVLEIVLLAALWWEVWKNELPEKTAERQENRTQERGN
jgi:hypothetical protein